MENSSDSKRELDNCLFVKTILMIVIVLDHSILFWTGGGNWLEPAMTPEIFSGLFTYMVSFFDSFQNYTFVLISGYLFYFVKYEKGGYSSFKTFLQSKIRRLLIPHMFVSMVWMIPITAYVFRDSLSFKIWQVLRGQPISQLWFLWMLFDVFIISYFLSDFFKNHTIGGFMSCFGFYAASILLMRKIPNILFFPDSLKYISFFYIGFKFRQMNLLARVTRKAKVMLTALYMLLLCNRMLSVNQSVSLTDKVLNAGFQFALHATGAVACFVLLQTLANQVDWKNSNFFCFLSRHHMQVYLFHQQVIYIVLLFLDGCVSLYINAIINFGAAISVSLLLSSFLLRFGIARTLLGEKRLQKVEKCND